MVQENLLFTTAVLRNISDKVNQAESKKIMKPSSPYKRWDIEVFFLASVEMRSGDLLHINVERISVSFLSEHCLLTP